MEQTGTVCHITGSRDEYAMKLSEANGRVIQISKVLHEREVQLRNLKDRQEKFVKEIANNTSKLATKYHMIESKKTAETTPQPIILAQHLAQRQQQQVSHGLESFSFFFSFFSILLTYLSLHTTGTKSVPAKFSTVCSKVQRS